jgi:hypothetical protein
MRLTMTPDVHVLIAAPRSDHPHHKIAYSVLMNAVAACTDGCACRFERPARYDYVDFSGQMDQARETIIRMV